MTTSEREKYDIAIVGGGCAGTVAAVAAARLGHSVVLLEQWPFLGGTSAAVLDSFYGFYAPGMPDRLVSGIAWEVICRLEAQSKVLTRPDEHGGGVGIGYDPEALKEVWDILTTESGVNLRLRSTVFAVDPQSGGGHVLRYYSHGSVREIYADYLVDASGDANAMALAGAQFLPASGHGAQAMTTTFRLAGVDVVAARSFDLKEFGEMLNRARNAGMDLPHDDVHIHRMIYESAALGLMTRIGDVDLSQPSGFAEAEQRGRTQARSYARFLRDFVPGYRDSHLMTFSFGIGVRESRRVLGRSTLTAEEVRNGAHLSDGVVLSGAPIEVQAEVSSRWEFLRPGTVYGVPFGTQVPVGVPAAVVAGRCISATPEAHASVRLMAQCMGLGQSAAVGIHLAITSGQPLESLSDVGVSDWLRAAKIVPDLSASPEPVDNRRVAITETYGSHPGSLSEGVRE